MVENVTQSKYVVTKCVDVSAKKQNIVKKIMLGIPPYETVSVTRIVRLGNMQKTALA